MLRYVFCVVSVAAGLVAVSACGTAETPAASTPTAPSAPGGPPFVLVQFDRGVGVVGSGSPEPRWIDADAVAAADGSAVFSVRRDGEHQLLRLDPRTGDVTSAWPVKSDISVSAVAPKGRWVALTARQDANTEIVVFDGVTGAEVRRLTLAGDLRPEAFSVDGSRIFALDSRGSYYRVQTIELATGDRFDTSDRDKTLLPDDMYGVSVRGVLSADDTLLATLYRNPANREEPAFVHVLDLEYGWSYCADLDPPFGTGPPGSDVIELTKAGTVVVAATQAARLAEINIAAVHKPGDTPVAVEYHDGTASLDESPFRSVPGFAHVIAPVSA